MENLKKVISLHQASVISGYHQDYLSSLIRKNEIRGEKVGRNWFTTEEEIKNYILKKEIQHKKSILKYFLYFKKVNKSFVYGFICLVVFSAGLYFYNKGTYDATPTRAQAQAQTQAIDTKTPESSQSQITEQLQF